MTNSVTFKQEPNLFQDITEFSIDSFRDHRRSSNFYRTDIIEFKESDKKYFPEVDNFEQYIGLWTTNCVVWDSEYGWDETFSELTRVNKVEKRIYEYAPVK